MGFAMDVRDPDKKATRKRGSRRGNSAPTIGDVAREAGCSPMTVSRVINGEGNVREATRETVREAIAAYKLRLLFDDAIEHRQTIREWERTGKWLKQVEPVETIRLWHRIDEGNNQIRFSLGVPPHS